MRDAMISARLISDGEQEHSRLSFVTEGEASLHFCLNKGLSRYTSVMNLSSVASFSHFMFY